MELARALLYNRDYKKSLEVINQIIKQRPDFMPAYEGKGWILYTMGQQREAIESFEYYKIHSAFPTAGLAGLAYVYARTLQSKHATEVKDLVMAISQDMPFHLVHIDLAIAHLGAQEYPAMFDQLRLAAKARMPALIFLETDPMWDEIRRFNEYRELKGLIFGSV